ncbi:MAG: hypothetical protein AB1744_10800 [Candidatus Zixiibacteriota bacterium]
MQKVLLFVVLFFVCCVLSHGESLIVVDEETLALAKADCERMEGYRGRQIGAYLEEDLALVGTVTGIYAKFSRQDLWMKVIDCEPRGNNWWEDYERAKKKNVLFHPVHFWRARQSEDVLVFDKWMSSVYAINLRHQNSIEVKLRKDFEKKMGKTIVESVRIWDDLVFFDIVSDFHDSILAVSPIDLSDFRMVFECPPALKRKLDSVGAGHTCRPAFNPIDSTIWLAFVFYNYIYLVDMDGRLLDSVEITDPNFRLPQPPRSRMHSNAVYLDWLSKCTPVTSFRYVPPGYFLLRYRSGWERLDVDSLPLYSTVVWTTDRKPVELSVDKSWELVGVQPDGRVIFANYLIEDNKTKEIVLSIARIEP